MTIERTKYVADVDAILEAADLKNDRVRDYVRYWAGLTGADNVEVVRDAGEIQPAGQDLY